MYSIKKKTLKALNVHIYSIKLAQYFLTNSKCINDVLQYKFFDVCSLM
jgi:hypothetical protein